MKQTLLLLFTLFATVAQAGVITMTAQATSPTNAGVAEFSIGPYEVAELLSYPVISAAYSSLQIIKDGKTNTYSQYVFTPNPPPLDPLVVAGPAHFRFVSQREDSAALCTFRITPEAFPPDRTIIALPGTNQTSITLECSTNLSLWFPATNGVYGPMPEAKFFRIKLERLP